MGKPPPPQQKKMSSIPICLSIPSPTIRSSAPLSLCLSPWVPSLHSLYSSSPWQSKSRLPSLAVSRCSNSDSDAAPALPPPEEEDEWLSRLPDKRKPLYSHSLPCIEAWLRSLGFSQSREDRAAWLIHKPEWHAQLSLDVTDLLIRYIKTGPGNLEKDMERRFSYALSREDIENAVLGGP